MSRNENDIGHIPRTDNYYSVGAPGPLGSVGDVNKADDEVKTALFNAVQRGNVSVVRALISAGADVNRTDNEGKTYLFYAVKQWNNESVVRTLLSLGASVKMTDNEGKTALFYAVRYYHEKIVRELIAAGSEVNRTDKEGKTALFYAVQQSKNKSVVRALIDTGADVNRTDNQAKTALFYAVQQSKNKSVVRALIDGGADVNRTDNQAKTALFYTVQNNNESVVGALIDADVDVNRTDFEGKTALFYAVQNNNESVVGALIDAGADVNRTDNQAKTALFYAVHQKNNERVIRTLIDAGADVNRTDNKGKTALFYAVQNNNESVVGALIVAGADVNRTDNEGKTALFYAVQNNNESVVGALIDAGADVNRTDNEGKTALFYAVEQWNNESVVRALIDAGADVNRTDNEGKTTLFYAVEQSNNESVIGALIDAGADVKRTDKEGKTALFYAVQQSSNESVVRALIDGSTDVNRTDNEGKTALFYAVQQSNNESVVRALIAAGADVNRTDNERKTTLFYAVQQSNNESVVGALIDASADVNKSALHLLLELLQRVLLCEDGELRKGIVYENINGLMEDVFNVCKEKGLSPIRGNSGNTPLHLWATLELAPGRDHYVRTLTEGYTFQKRLKVIFDHLRENNAQLNIKNENGETPLHLCRTWAAVELLLDAGANPNVVDSSGRSPLLVAANINESVKTLGTLFPDVSLAPHVFWKTVLKRGLDPWTVDKDGESVLSIIIRSESRDLASAMVEVACEKRRHHPLLMFSLLTSICKDTLAIAHWKKDIAEMILISTKCPVNGNKNEDSPLHYCCRNIIEALKGGSSVDEIKRTVHWNMVELLRSYGADYRNPDASGLTCLQIAQKCPALKELLLEPIYLDKHEVLIAKWKGSVSKTHDRYLPKVARGLGIVKAKPYWYHKDPLACGSFGTVFAGINKNDGREVAIKRIENARVQLSEDQREITHLIALTDCEQVVRYLNFLKDETYSYIVLELMEGNLDQLIDNPKLTDNNLTLCQDVIKGMQFLHQQDILHRDLKPKNILFKTYPKLCLKIADFALSRCMDSTGSTSTVYGSNVGTRCWIAPEVLKPTKPHSRSSDVFACGLVLHYILSVKKHPFAPADRTKRSMMHVTQTETNIILNEMKGWDDSLCPEAAHLIKQMLDSDDSKRPTAAESLDHPFFWTNKKKVDLLRAVGNQPEFECPRARRTSILTAVESDLESKFTDIVEYGKWNDSGYVHMPAIYDEMTNRRSYDTNSVVELLRFVRNACAHAPEKTAPIPKLLLEDFVFLEYFPNLVMEVYKAVTTHGWDQTRVEIKSALQGSLTR